LGFNTFSIAPQLPDEWDTMELKNIMAYTSAPFDIKVIRIDKDKIRITIVREGKIVKNIYNNNGQTSLVKL
jgi:Zn/Cd-binding protein ZinT